jgi:hypothetical protein
MILKTSDFFPGLKKILLISEMACVKNNYSLWVIFYHLSIAGAGYSNFRQRKFICLRTYHHKWFTGNSLLS